MYLFFPILLSAVLVEMGPGSLKNYLLLYQFKKSQIAVDNSLILLGRADRKLFQWIEKSNQAMEKLHLFHHESHRCARVPKTAAVCIPLDLKTEASLVAAQAKIKATAVLSWRMNVLEARKSFLSLGTKSAQFSRAAFPPLSPRSCSFCSFQKGWEVNLKDASTEALVEDSGTRAEGAIQWRKDAYRRPQYQFTK